MTTHAIARYAVDLVRHHADPSESITITARVGRDFRPRAVRWAPDVDPCFTVDRFWVRRPNGHVEMLTTRPFSVGMFTVESDLSRVGAIDWGVWPKGAEIGVTARCTALPPRPRPWWLRTIDRVVALFVRPAPPKFNRFFLTIYGDDLVDAR